jgi:hypothetical protein
VITSILIQSEKRDVKRKVKKVSEMGGQKRYGKDGKEKNTLTFVTFSITFYTYMFSGVK